MGVAQLPPLARGLLQLMVETCTMVIAVIEFVVLDVGCILFKTVPWDRLAAVMPVKMRPDKEMP